MQSKQQIREELEAAVAAFLKNGGKIKKGKTKKIKANRKVTA